MVIAVRQLTSSERELIAANARAGIVGALPGTLEAWASSPACLENEPKELDMSDVAASSETTKKPPRATASDMKLEAIVIPVSDVDRAKAFYSRAGWRLDADFVVGDQFRVVQFTPPGSACSLHFGKGLTTASPGSVKTTYLVVSDIETARKELLARGVDVGEVFHTAGPGTPAMPGRDPRGRSYSSFATFSDPDGNGWLLQEITQRLPGRVDAGDTTFSSSAELARALRRAASAHGEHESRTGGVRDENWPDWYAQYIVAERVGAALPS